MTREMKPQQRNIETSVRAANENGQASRVLSAVMLCLNLASIGFGIGYAAHPAYSPAWDAFGVVLLVALFGNFLLVYVIDQAINRHTRRGNQLNWMGYGVIQFS